MICASRFFLHILLCRHFYRSHVTLRAALCASTLCPSHIHLRFPPARPALPLSNFLFSTLYINPFCIPIFLPYPHPNPFLFFFFLMRRPPPRSTLFPSTTPSR